MHGADHNSLRLQNEPMLINILFGWLERVKKKAFQSHHPNITTPLPFQTYLFKQCK